MIDADSLKHHGLAGVRDASSVSAELPVPAAEVSPVVDAEPALVRLAGVRARTACRDIVEARAARGVDLGVDVLLGLLVPLLRVVRQLVVGALLELCTHAVVDARAEDNCFLRVEIVG